MAWFNRLGRRWCSIASSPTTHLLRNTNKPSLTPPDSLMNGELYRHRHDISNVMHKSAFESNILRLLRSEIRYEKEYAPPMKPVLEFDGFTVEDKPGEQWVRLKAKYGDDEDIKIDATMFDGVAPADIYGEKRSEQLLHISLVVDIIKGNDESNALEFICSAWPDAVTIHKVYKLRQGKMPLMPYLGPGFHNMKEELKDALHLFLKARGVNEDLAMFLHEYMMNKDKIELIHWMEKLKSFVEK